MSDRFIDARCGIPIDECPTCSAIAKRYGRPITAMPETGHAPASSGSNQEDRP